MQLQTCAWKRSSERATTDLGSDISTCQVRFSSSLSTMSEPTDAASQSMMWTREEIPPVWKWFTDRGSDAEEERQAMGSAIRRYCGFFIDEFGDLTPVQKGCCEHLHEWQKQGWLRDGARILVAGYAVDPALVTRYFGAHAMLDIPGRKYTLERCVLAPTPAPHGVLECIAHMIVAALARSGEHAGNALAFLPGWAEMVSLHELLLPQVAPRRIIMLHSDNLGTPEEQRLEVQEDERAPLVILSTDVATRGITLRTIRYTFIHAHNRTSALFAMCIAYGRRP